MNLQRCVQWRRLADGGQAAGGSLAVPAGTSQEGGAQPWQHNIHQSVKAHTFCPFSLILFHSGLQWRRPTQLFIQLKTSDAENAANLAFCLQRSAKNGFFHTIGRGQKKQHEFTGSPTGLEGSDKVNPIYELLYMNYMLDETSGLAALRLVGFLAVTRPPASVPTEARAAVHLFSLSTSLTVLVTFL